MILYNDIVRFNQYSLSNNSRWLCPRKNLVYDKLWPCKNRESYDKTRDLGVITKTITGWWFQPL